MARPKKVIPKEHIVTTQSFKTEASTAVMDDPKDEIPLDKEIAIVTQSNMPKYEKIIFINNRDPGRELEFFFVSATHPYKRYKLFHGKEYLLSHEVINHLEGMNPKDPNSCQAVVYEDKYDEKSGMVKSTIASYKPLYQCKTIRGR